MNRNRLIEALEICKRRGWILCQAGYIIRVYRHVSDRYHPDRAIWETDRLNHDAVEDLERLEVGA